ncbi:M60 family metallopeptidase [Bacteroides neonati]|uniref:M60 family metallopeptidase n=1 Tax=Bacteroides neonati TaxID=1347393 RepID=UPI0004BB1491|nr:M60 family metallopeptidase [Bacteroides neonati]
MRKKTILLNVLLLVFVFTCCADRKEDILTTFEIAQSDISKSVDKNAVKISIPVITTLPMADWGARSDVNWLFVSKKSDTAGSMLEVSVSANTGDIRTGTIQVTSSVKNYTITVKQYGNNDVIVEDDIQVKPYGGKDSEHQSGQDITNTYDGKFSSDGGSPFHTPWGQSAKFPVILEYYFNGKELIDYLIYYTRSGNGNFGKLKLYIATDTDRKEYILQGEYDFKEQNAPSRISFSQGVKATGIRFEVMSGLGNFVSCDEMQFFKRNEDTTLDKQLLKVFKDITCTDIKEDATNEDIAALPTYFIRIAETLKAGSYDAWEKNFRVREYAPYSNVEEWAAKLMTKKYSNLDNPTGISVKKGDEIIVLVGDTYGHDISLQCIWETGRDYKQTAASGDVYMLRSGVNKFIMKEQGQLFVMYNTDLSSSTAKPIKIHIPLGSGLVSGFFDLKEHRTDSKYAELLRKATHKYFCVKGEKIIFYFHRDKMLSHLPDNILSAINLWDDIIGWQQELMGITDVRPSQVNNHIFAISPEGSYMWASDYQIGFVYTYLGNILLKDNVMAAEDNAWGPAHEIGHIHQAAINWPGSTESSNNLFSNYIIYKLGKYKSRGSGLMKLANARFVDKQAWYNMGTATHQGEDTETHMRMNWQLWNYYHRCGFKKDFWPRLFNLMREDANRVPETSPGKRQLTFAMMASKAAGENLEEFFDLWGFFEPVSSKVNQYGEFDYIVTPKMIEDARQFIRQYPKKAAPIQYLEDRKKTEFGASDYRYKEVGDVGYYTQFQNKQKITKTVTYTRSGQMISIQNGDEAVAFEIKRGNDLLFFSNFTSFEVPSAISLDIAQLYAVQTDGERLLINVK